MKKQKIRTVCYGLEAALYPTPQLWCLVPWDIKSLPNVNLFTSKVNHRKYSECSDKLHETYLKKVGYV